MHRSFWLARKFVIQPSSLPHSSEEARTVAKEKLPAISPPIRHGQSAAKRTRSLYEWKQRSRRPQGRGVLGKVRRWQAETKQATLALPSARMRATHHEGVFFGSLRESSPAASLPLVPPVPALLFFYFFSFFFCAATASIDIGGRCTLPVLPSPPSSLVTHSRALLVYSACPHPPIHPP